MIKYDDASFHSNGDFPPDLPPEAGATHTGMFLAWALLNGLGGLAHTSVRGEQLAQLRTRRITPGKYFLTECDGKLTDEDLSQVGNLFAQHYYDLDSGEYLSDYETLSSDLQSLYHVPDSWDTYDKLAPLITRRYDLWKRTE